jgi:AcrR family transcriptional regulator
VVLRDVQRMAGVSNSAAYRHYADRDALLAAVTEYAENRLADAMVARMNAVANRGPKANRALGRLRATGQGYIDFALAEPGLFRTAFAHSGAGRGTHTRQAEGAETQMKSHHPFHILIRCIDDLVSVGVLSADRRDGLDEAVWAAVHGLSMLFLDGPLSEVDAHRKQLMTDRLLDLIGGGLR